LHRATSVTAREAQPPVRFARNELEVFLKQLRSFPALNRLV
jgi:hypothetical protein